MSTKIIEMPHLGESVTEASIAVWLVSEGDKIEKYDPIAEAVSDKVTTEIPSNYSGIVKEFLIELDTDVEIGTPIVKIETEDAGADEVESEQPVGAEAPSDPEKKEEMTEHINEEIDKEADKRPMERETTETKQESAASRSVPSTDKNTRYSPAVVRIAQERGIDLNQVEGSGKHGRITRKDVQNFDVDSQGKQNTARQTVSNGDLPKASLAVQKGLKKKAEQASAEPVSYTSSGDEVVQADGIRKAIAKKMVQSATEIPHAWLMVEADVSNIVKLRNKTKEQFKKQEGVTLSYFPFFVKAVVQALKKHPIMNASWDNGNIVYHKDINISVAVATDEHLFVPVIHNTDNYSISGLSKEISRLATLARDGKLSSQDIQGGTMTVNNTGSFGSVQSMGIINHPQAAILQVESITKRFVPTEDGGFKAADIINLCLSIDHRIIDGLQAGRFLKDVKENLQRFTDESDLY
ncbi:2-oxoisovalerate dehydrogenase E2 component (dihydrolipoyl transacylase) [Alkalibacterium subtropicum]|uniref:Dihydrolipoamide acetyltransferase component of pyruvate dehydrogenase complex n=1 Tax=Alkalibacterium subtropicum TaxID=753702 RepID=A0A1I1I8Z1_9LACT|nr:dihydrolipoamide acetyltransferase family protein [Alkalibacterium subtropicum]SFC32727.1 2-oxoisovalerate dehydrogenase E2 component (dihydrolipoyl transacylase) [Alkalibacterium subtropicum]